MSPRTFGVVLGIWLFISAFLWPHSHAELTNTWLSGILCIAFAVMALRTPNVRYLNTALAAWLFISAFALPSIRIGTVWNNAIVAVALFIASLVESTVETPTRRTPIQPA